MELFHNLDMPFVPVVAALEQAGIVLDVAYLKQFGDQLAEQLATLESEIYALAGMNFNVSSPKSRTRPTSSAFNPCARAGLPASSPL